MLLYSNRSTIRQILELNGAIVYRRDIVFKGLVLAGACCYLQHLIDKDSPWAPRIANNYAMNALGTIVGFATVFRSNLAWQRYWDAVTQVQIMYSKWSDTFTQFSVFARSTIRRIRDDGQDSDMKTVRRLEAMLQRVYLHFQLLSALASDRLSHGDVELMNRRAVTGKWREQMTTRHALGSESREAHPGSIRSLPQFKSAHESSDWMTMGSKMDRVNWTMPDGWTHCYRVKFMPSEAELKLLDASHDRVNVVMAWILRDLAWASKDFMVPPPIQSRMYQEMSNGMIGFLNALKIADVPFPFPMAQMLIVVVILFAIFIPVWVSCFTNSMIAGPIISFALWESVCSINEVAKDLENPFGDDPNDIPLYDFHMRFCDAMDETEEALEMANGELDYGDPVERSPSNQADVSGNPEITDARVGASTTRKFIDDATENGGVEVIMDATSI